GHVWRGSRGGGVRGWRSSLPMLRLRGRGCRHCSRNDKNYGDACFPLEHDTTSYVVHKSTPEMACWFRLRRGRGLHVAYMWLTWRAKNECWSFDTAKTLSGRAPQMWYSTRGGGKYRRPRVRLASLLDRLQYRSRLTRFPSRRGLWNF